LTLSISTLADNKDDPASSTELDRSAQAEKLLFIVDTGFPTFRADVADLFGTFLPTKGVSIDLVAKGGSTDKQWPAGELFLSHAKPGLPIPGKGILNDFRTLMRIKRGTYFAIQVRNKVPTSLFALWRAKALGIPFFYWMSFPMAEAAIREVKEKGGELGLKRRLYLMVKGYVGRALLFRYVLPNATHVFVQSDKMRADLAEKGIPFARMTPVPMGIDPDRFPTDIPPSDDPRLAGRRVIAYLGTCERVRRVDFLFDVTAILAKEFPDVTLLVIGDAASDDDKKWLRQSVSERKVDENVLITGWLPQESARSYLSKAEVALALMVPDPLLDSTSPTKLVEYLAMGKAVVANEHPDQRKVLQESGAGFVTSLDAAEFAEGIAKLLRDETLRKTIAGRGRDYVIKNRSYDVIARAVADAYAVLKAKPSTP